MRDTTLAKITRKQVWCTISDAHSQVYEKARINNNLLRLGRRLHDKDPFYDRWAQAHRNALVADQNTLNRQQRHSPQTIRFTDADDVNMELKIMGINKADAIMEANWDAECAAHTFRPPATYMEKWATDVFATHKGLSRVEEVNLVRLKMECVQVGAYMFRIGPAYHPGCPCGAKWQNVYHLFARCPLLSDARQQLIAETGHDDFYRWLTHDAGTAAKWATKNFGIVVYDWLLHYLRALDPDPSLSRDHSTDLDIITMRTSSLQSPSSCASLTIIVAESSADSAPSLQPQPPAATKRQYTLL
jgi:hypothetical protein